MSMVRRADILDRGRRWIPKNGKFGTVTMSFNRASVTIGVSFKETPVPTAIWEVTDWDGGKTTVNGNNPTFSFNTANGGTVFCKLPGTVNVLSGASTSCNLVSFKQGNKFSDFLTACFYSNQLQSFPGYDWPSLTRYYLYSNPSLATITTKEWPNLEELQLEGCTTLQDFDTYDWPKIRLIDLKNCDALVNFDGDHEWPLLEKIEISYTDSIETVTTNNGWASVNEIDVRFGLLTEFETHSGWTSLEKLLVAGNSLSGTFNTYDTWNQMTLLDISKNYGITDFTIHTTWNSFNYLDARSEPMTNNCIDNFLIACDNIGTSNGYIDYRLAPNRNDANRSASANTAISNLTTKGWAVLR